MTRWHDELGKLKKDRTAQAEDKEFWNKLGVTFARQWESIR